MGVLAGEVVGVFAHVERAAEHGAGVLQTFDERGVRCRGRVVAVDLGAGEGGDTFDVEQVLDRVRNTGQWSDDLAVGDGAVDRGSFFLGAFCGDFREGVEIGIEAFDARQRVVDGLDGAEFSAADGGSQPGGALRYRAHAENTGAGSSTGGRGCSSSTAAMRALRR
ncbi:MAG: hypothetical protein P8Z69_09775 [Acidihalobacter sp.]